MGHRTKVIPGREPHSSGDRSCYFYRENAKSCVGARVGVGTGQKRECQATAAAGRDAVVELDPEIGDSGAGLRAAYGDGRVCVCIAFFASVLCSRTRNTNRAVSGLRNASLLAARTGERPKGVPHH